jgi:hypothetical protein
VHPSRQPSDRPILITEAPVNADDEFDRRRKRYLLMMTIRALCIVGAATTFRVSGWLAAVFVVAALVLPWCAVLIANDRPPKQEMRFRRFVGAGQPLHQELTAAEPVESAADGDEPKPRSGPPPMVIDI